MNRVCNPDRARSLIRENLISLGANPLAKEEESLLIRSGAYCGHRISKDGLRAIWFVEEDQVKFFGREGQLLDAINPSKEMLARAAAA